MRAVNRVHIVEGGDHSLLVTQAQLKICRESQDEVDERILVFYTEFSRKAFVIGTRSPAAGGPRRESRECTPQLTRIEPLLNSRPFPS